MLALDAREKLAPSEYIDEETILRYWEEPSSIALGRMEFFSARINLDEEDTPLARYRYFARHQKLGFYEEVIEILHSDDHTFYQFLSDRALRDPGLILGDKRIFEATVPAEEREEFARDYCEHNLDRFVDVLPTMLETIPENVRESVAIMAAEERASSWGLRRLSIIGAHIDDEGVQSIVRKCMLKDMKNESNFWFSMELGFAYGPGHRFGANGTLRNLKKCIDKGVVSSEEIETDINERINGDRVFRVQYNHIETVEDEALDTRLLFMLNGIIDSPEDMSSDELIMQYLKTRYSRGELDDVANLNHIVRRLHYSGIIQDVEAIKSVCREIEGNGHVYAGDLESAKEDFYSSEKLVVDDEEIRRLYKRCVVEEVDLAGTKHAMERNYILDICKSYKGELREEAIEIMSKMFGGPRRHNVTHWIDALVAVCETRPDVIRRLVMQDIKDGKPINFQKWHKWIEFTDLEHDDVVKMFISSMTEQQFLGNITSDVKSVLDNNKPLLGMQEAGQILRDLLRDRDFIQGRSELSSFCIQYLGEKLTKELFGDLTLDEAPDIVAMINGDDLIYDTLEGGEYYDVLKLMFHLKSMNGYLSKEAVDIFIDSVFKNLSDEHQVYAGYYLWDFLDDNKKLEWVEIVSKNAISFSRELRSPYFRSKLKSLGYDKALMSQGSSGKDYFELLAPKAFRSFKRRLNKKRDQGAQINHLYETYAYHCNLINRLVTDDENIERVLAILRGKKTEKNELRALEGLVLLRESAGAQDMAGLADLSREDLERLIADSISRRSGLSDEEADVLYQFFVSENVDIVKYSMWMHESFRSKKLHGYFSALNRHFAEGGSVDSWKYSTPFGNNIDELNMTDEQKEVWMSERVLSLKTVVGDIKVRFTNDINTIYLSGARPVKNCLHYANGFNQHGIAGLLNADSKMVHIENSNGNPAGNAIIRLTEFRGQVFLMLEPLYHAFSDEYEIRELNRVVAEVCADYADSLGVEFSIAIIGNDLNIYHTAKELFAKRFAEITHDNTALASSMAPYSYTDENGVGIKRSLVSVVVGKVFE